MRKFNHLVSTGLVTVSAVALPQAAMAQDAGTDEVSEIIVTANRRAEDVTAIPYNISAIGGAQLEKQGITSFEALTKQVPNLNLNSTGSRGLGAQRPVIRGLNASDGNRLGQALEQSPVATYLGNVPVPGGVFPIEDIERVEVLRGPQGTLYGAGALGGAIRILPSPPKLSVFEGDINASIGVLSHSSVADYSLGGTINLPLGDTLAVRATATHQRNAGFIDKYGVLVTQGDFKSAPILANPSDVANSSGVTKTMKDFNFERIDSGRVSLLWKPTEKLELVAAYNVSEIRGDGGPMDNPNFQGGPNPLDPRVQYPALKPFDIVLYAEEPFKWSAQLASLDATYDVGFATLAATASYLEIEGSNAADATFGVLRAPPTVAAYYTGSPANPRFFLVQTFDSKSELTTAEVRAVSNGNGPVQFVAGVYYQHERNSDIWNNYIPGTPDQVIASGGVAMSTNPGDNTLPILAENTFIDKAVFGELTWNPTASLKLTGGARLFQQEFRRSIDFNLPLFFLSAQSNNRTKISDSIFKFNAIYEWNKDQNVYALFSQGFRRGGANAFAISGPLAEPLSLLDYKPDRVDNYEFGLKGRLGNGWRYQANAYLDNWEKPQIGTFTLIGWPVVVNGDEAKSYGFEAEVSGRLNRSLSFSIGYAYAEAKLTRDFCIASGDFAGGLIPCAIQGLKDSRLPGSPRHSGTIDLDYSHDLANGDTVNLGVNAIYRGDILNGLPAASQPETVVPGYWNVDLRSSWTHGRWTLSAYIKNLFNQRNVLAIDTRGLGSTLGSFDDFTLVGRPRSAGLQLRYKW